MVHVPAGRQRRMLLQSFSTCLWHNPHPPIKELAIVTTLSQQPLIQTGKSFTARNWGPTRCFLRLFVQRRRKWATQYQPSPFYNWAMYFFSLTLNPPTYTCTVLLLMQNLSPKDIARSDIMKLKVLWRISPATSLGLANYYQWKKYLSLVWMHQWSLSSGWVWVVLDLRILYLRFQSYIYIHSPSTDDCPLEQYFLCSSLARFASSMTGLLTASTMAPHVEFSLVVNQVLTTSLSWSPGSLYWTLKQSKVPTATRSWMPRLYHFARQGKMSFKTVARSSVPKGGPEAIYVKKRGIEH